MRRKKTLWLLIMAALCLVLYTIVVTRMDSKQEIIFGGVDGTYVNKDDINFQDPNELNAPEPTEDIWPDIDIYLAQYTIANDDNLLSSAFAPETATIAITKYMQFDVLALPYLDAMIQDMQDAGFDVYVAGAYRTYSYQTNLFNSMASQIAYGYGVTDYMDPIYQKAAEEARKITRYPGSSEHQLGLAVDLMDKAYSKLIYEDMDPEFFEYLDSICAKYGFIKRYPTKKLLLTGWDEPWHYRYVGVEAATFIMENGLCYEEFYAHYVQGFEY